jgi:hypothetical protein
MWTNFYCNRKAEEAKVEGLVVFKINKMLKKSFFQLDHTSLTLVKNLSEEKLKEIHTEKRKKEERKSVSKKE